MRARRTTAVVSGCVSLGLTAACSAVLGITDFTPADGGADASSDHALSETGPIGPADGGEDAAEAGPPCTPGATECSGNGVSTCSASGQWGPGADCGNQTCVGGVCTGVCAPDATQCSGTTLLSCAADGGWQTTTACPETCSGGACTHFPSCQGGGPGAGTDCGPGGVGDAGADGGVGVDCCASLEVPGGTFDRSYDDVYDVNPSYAATVSGLRVDAFEATVGRFRAFVSAWLGGWSPSQGAGKHAYLNAGNGLANSANPGAFETGWSTSWNNDLAGTQPDWDANLTACDPSATWTSIAGADERDPINCVTWYEAYAFCIWDGGFLPSEAEWNYTASGGGQQRVYPWSVPPNSTTIDCSYANYLPNIDGSSGISCSGAATNPVGLDSPKGDGRWGQSDLAGNVWEWNADGYSTWPPPSPQYVTPCDDCAYLAPSTSTRVARGGGYDTFATAVIASYRVGNPPAQRFADVGIRCGRAP